MIRGIIYKYTSPSGKVYIGLTRNEKDRRQSFYNINRDYAGTKINKARAKYGPENFEYLVLYSIESTNIQEVIQVLNLKEIEFIELFDSFYNGYNNTLGGETPYIRTEESTKKLSKSVSNYYKTHKSTVSKAVLLFTEDGDFVQEWESARLAALALDLFANSITNVCKKKQNKTGGFIWRYKSDFKEIPLKIQIRSKYASELPVILYSLDGIELQRWRNLTIAAKELGYSLGNFSMYCNGKNNHEYKGFLYYRGDKNVDLEKEHRYFLKE